MDRCPCGNCDRNYLSSCSCDEYENWQNKDKMEKYNLPYPCSTCRLDPAFCSGCQQKFEWEDHQNNKEEILSKSKFVRLSSPEDIKLKNQEVQIQSLINEIEKEFRKDNFGLKFKDHVSFNIEGEKYSKEVRDIVCDLYKQKGWSNVTHKTSSENGERGGLTGFKFYW